MFADKNETNNEVQTSTSNASVTQITLSKIEESKKTISLSVETVRAQIKNGLYSVREVKKRHSKNSSPVWKYIQHVIDENQNVIAHFYCCSNCSNIIPNESKSTTPFIRHIETCILEKKQIPITQFATTSMDEPTQNTIKVSMQYRQKLKDGMAQFVCNDLRPFVAVEGAGFVAAMCASFELGQANPKLGASDFQIILPGRKTVQKEIESKVDSAKKKVKTTLQQAYQAFGGFACTSDMWSDDYRQKNYIAVTAHVPVLCSNRISFERYVIGVEEVTEVVKSKEVVEQHILTILSRYGFLESEVKSSIYFVTDRGSNFKAIDKFKRANCYAHMLHNIVKAMCKDTELSEVISNARDLVRYIKKAGLNYRCELHLQSYCETRWSTVYTMLKSIHIKFDDVYKVLEERQKTKKQYSDCLQYIECLHKSTLFSIVKLLEPFKVWTDYVEADKYITIHRVCPIYTKVNNFLRVSIEKDTQILNSKNFKFIEGIKALGRDYIRSIKSDFEPTQEQNIAIALHPRTKKMKKMSDAIREKTYNSISELISSDTRPPPIDTTGTKEKKRTSINLFDSFADSDEDENANSNEETYGEELDEYLRLPNSDNSAYNDEGNSINLSQWWFKHRSVFPNLFKLFMRISCIPASSAPSERCFSVTGQIITEKRSCISPENVGNIMMCRNLYNKNT